MDGQEAFKRIQQQLKRASNQGGGGKLPGGPGGLLAGGGLVAALIAGGLLLNASLFNGTIFGYYSFIFGLLIRCVTGNSGRWSPSD
jgi:hypothetical protein